MQKDKKNQMCFLTPRFLQPKFLFHSFSSVSRNMSLICPIVMPLVRLSFFFSCSQGREAPTHIRPSFVPYHLFGSSSTSTI